jgi:hypothetical protein
LKGKSKFRKGRTPTIRFSTISLENPGVLTSPIRALIMQPHALSA